jgi:DNA-binding GntR family transcriptional regulator
MRKQPAQHPRGAPERARLAAAGGHRTLAEKAYVVLHDAILSGELAPGERLRIEELAELLEMSPMPIREAVRQLDAAGLVEHAPHRATRVTDLSLGDLEDVYRARLALEPLAVRLGAPRFGDEDARLARAALERYVAAYRAGDAHATWEAHTAFHFALYRASGSRWLERLITPLWETSERYRRASLPVARRLEERQREHERILDACTRRDAEAASHEMHDHLAQSANLLARAMGGEDLFALLPPADPEGTRKTG